MLNRTLSPHQRVNGAVAVRADVFPAVVSFSFAEDKHQRARAILTADEVIVLVESGTSAPSVLYQERLEDVQFLSRQTVTATTADGEVTISRGSGCGCGSRLRGYRPFGRTVRMARIPA